MLLAAAASYVAPGESSIGVGKTSLSDAPRYLRLPYDQNGIACSSWAMPPDADGGSTIARGARRGVGGEPRPWVGLSSVWVGRH